MRRKQRQKRVRHRSLASHAQVRDMASAGLVEDQIALRINGGMHKNELRRKYIDSIKEGRAIATAARAAAEAAELSRKDKERIEIVTAVWNSDWYDPEIGECLLFPDCKTLEEALEQSKKHWR